MNRLTWLRAAVAVPLFGLAFSAAVAQTPAPVPRPPPAAAIYPYANPILNQYQRNRELREQTALQRQIQDLQRLEVLKATRQKLADPLADTTEPKEPAKGSFSVKKTPVTSTPKTAPMKPAETTSETPTTAEAAVPKRAPTWSNYKDLLKKN